MKRFFVLLAVLLASPAFADVTGPVTPLGGTPAAAGITGLTGDVTGTGPGSTAATIPVGTVTDTKASLANKPTVGLVTVTTPTLSGAQTIDGVLGVAGTTLVLVANPTPAATNGPWLMQSGAWTRPAWYPSGGTTQAFQFVSVRVRLGTTYAGSLWDITNSGAVTIDTTATTWSVKPMAANSSTLSSASDLSSINVTATGGTTAQTLAARAASAISVKDFGAVGDCTTDDWPAFQAAIQQQAALTNGGVVTVPAPASGGCWRIAQALRMQNNVTVQVLSPATTIKCTADALYNDAYGGLSGKTNKFPFTSCVLFGSVTSATLGTNITAVPLNTIALGDTTVTATTAANVSAYVAGDLIEVESTTSFAQTTTDFQPSVSMMNRVTAVNAGTGVLTLAYPMDQAFAVSTGIAQLGTLTGTATTGTYTGVSLTGGTGTGGVATVIVTAGVPSSVTITTRGSGYVVGDALTYTVTGSSGTGVTVSSLVGAQLKKLTNNGVQAQSAPGGNSGVSYWSTYNAQVLGGSWVAAVSFMVEGAMFDCKVDVASISAVESAFSANQMTRSNLKAQTVLFGSKLFESGHQTAYTKVDVDTATFTGLGTTASTPIWFDEGGHDNVVDVNALIIGATGNTQAISAGRAFNNKTRVRSLTGSSLSASTVLLGVGVPFSGITYPGTHDNVIQIDYSNLSSQTHYINAANTDTTSNIVRDSAFYGTISATTALALSQPGANNKFSRIFANAGTLVADSTNGVSIVEDSYVSGGLTSGSDLVINLSSATTNGVNSGATVGAGSFTTLAASSTLNATGLLTATAGVAGPSSVPFQVVTTTGLAAVVQNSSPDTNGVGLNLTMRGNAATTTGAGGGSSLTGGVGCCSGDGGVGGATNQTAGAGSGTGNGGQANVTGGVGGATGAGGNSISGGGKGGATSGAGGNSTLIGGAAGDASVSNGGAANVTGGAAGTASGTGVGGSIAITSGAGGATSGNSGSVNIKGGAVTSGTIGGVNIQASNNGATNIGTGTTTSLVTIGGGSNAVTVNATTLTLGGSTLITSSSPFTDSNAAFKLTGITTGTNADTVCLKADGTLLIQAAACTISSLRFKENVKSWEGSALAEIMGLKAFTYNMKPNAEPNRDPNYGANQIGLTAEEVAKVEPKCALYESDMKTPKSYRQECVIAMLVKGEQELVAQNTALKARLSRLEKRRAN